MHLSKHVVMCCLCRVVSMCGGVCRLAIKNINCFNPGQILKVDGGSGPHEMSPSTYHCKYNYITFNNIIICFESTCANYRCKTMHF